MFGNRNFIIFWSYFSFLPYEKISLLVYFADIHMLLPINRKNNDLNISFVYNYF